MTPARRGSWWWGAAGAAGGTQLPGGGRPITFGIGGLSSENERRRRELGLLGGNQLHERAAAAPYNHQQPRQQQQVNSDMFQLGYPRPRLRWTVELHRRFVRAVDQLGGANKATPKAILSVMDIEGLTLYHLKSHLQKFRLGKTGRKLWRREFVATNYRRQRDERLPPLNVAAQPPPPMPNAFERNRSTSALVAETCGNLHLLVQPQSAMGSQLGGASAVKLEEFGGVKPALLPLFPPVPSSGMSYSPELLDGGGRRAVAPRPVEKASMHDYYLGSLGYSSSEFAVTKTRASRRDGMNFGSFLDEVASFSKVDGAGLAPDGNNAFGHRSS